MLWSIDSSQNKISADQYYMTILQAQVKSSLRSHISLMLTADQVIFPLDRGLKSCFFLPRVMTGQSVEQVQV